MTYMNSNDARRKLVIKSNTLIQKSKFNLTTLDQRIILYLISNIKRDATELTPFRFYIQDFCQVCGIDYLSGGYYNQLRDTIQNLADKSIWVDTENGGHKLFRWIAEAETFPESGIIEIQLKKDLEPYLLRLRSNFTSYELVNTLNYRCKYSTRMYELLKSMHYHQLETYQTKVFDLDELKDLLGVFEYDRTGKRIGNLAYEDWQPFKKRCLEPALREINKYSDINVQYNTEIKKREVQRAGHKPVIRAYVSGVSFIIETKPIEERIKIQAEIETKFGLTQMTFEELCGE